MLQKAAHEGASFAFQVFPLSAQNQTMNAHLQIQKWAENNTLPVRHIAPKQALSNTLICFRNETSKLQCLFQKSVSGHRHI